MNEEKLVGENECMPPAFEKRDVCVKLTSNIKEASEEDVPDTDMLLVGNDPKNGDHVDEPTSPEDVLLDKEVRKFHHVVLKNQQPKIANVVTRDQRNQ